MNIEEKLQNTLAQISFLFESYEFSPYCGGRVSHNYIIDDHLKNDIKTIQEHLKLNLVQATHFKEQLQTCHEFMLEFPQLLKDFVETIEFDNYWKKISNKQKDCIVFSHEDSYFILRKKLQPHEIMPIDMKDIIQQSQIEWSSKIKDIFNLSEEFNDLPFNKLQLLKQKKALTDLGYNLSNLREIPSMYVNSLVTILCENKNNQELLEVINQLNLDIPHDIKSQMNFIKSNEEKISNGTMTRIKM